MSRLDEETMYRELATALRAGAGAVPDFLRGGDARRFAVHRNNVHRALGDALADAYPVVRRVVGDAFFRAAAHEFRRAESVRAPSLALYGAGFADFLERFAPAASVPWLADLARLERARLEASLAADAPALAPTRLAAIGEAQLPDARLVPHPAARLVRSLHPIVALHGAHASASSGPIEVMAAPESALVTRPGDVVRIASLEPVAATLAAALLGGATPTEACRVADGAGPLDLAATFATLLDAGAFTDIAPR
ncbi:MAG: putative DNA-binding domain-containing protein [Ectothiorhodospiraceae bacterium]|nr:putative DNA-binding domain-containing protein [Ectothiorhodospiraceae bacterium]